MVVSDTDNDQLVEGNAAFHKLLSSERIYNSGPALIHGHSSSIPTTQRWRLDPYKDGVRLDEIAYHAGFPANGRKQRENPS